MAGAFAQGADLIQAWSLSGAVCEADAAEVDADEPSGTLVSRMKPTLFLREWLQYDPITGTAKPHRTQPRIIAFTGHTSSSSGFSLGLTVRQFRLHTAAS
eukprot:1790270-Amphidinium_carterae.1